MGDKDTFFATKTRAINCGGRELDFSIPRIMGVLNLTPDSFYDGGKYHQEKTRAKKVEQMLKDGADIIDIGAVSTRPGAKEVSQKDEMNRLIWPLQRLAKLFPEALFSVDTWRSEVARESILNGAHIINDISGGNFDGRMFETVAELKAPYILMHIHGSPEDMQSEPLDVNIIATVYEFFKKKVGMLNKLGVDDIILDPGFGFGKTLKCNYTLLKNLEKLRIGDLPVLGGISRKSMINKVINSRPSEALNGTTVLNTIALLNGANMLRVHDVKEAAEALRILEYYTHFSNCGETGD